MPRLPTNATITLYENAVSVGKTPLLTAFNIATFEKVLNITQKKHNRKLLTYPNMLLEWQGH